MYLESKLSWNVVLPTEKLNVDGLMLQKAITTRLMADFEAKKVTDDLGYFVALTTVVIMGEGKVRHQTGDILFPVDFHCITFKMFIGEVLEGTVHKILKNAVFLECGPVKNIYLPCQKMDDYQYVPVENPYFMNPKPTKIEKGAVLRFVVIGLKYIEAEKEFQVLASLEGGYLGPVS